jgi:hypothetical protein
MTHSEHLGAPIAVDDAPPVLIRMHPGHASVCPEGAISYLGPATEQSR